MLHRSGDSWVVYAGSAVNALRTCSGFFMGSFSVEVEEEEEE